MEHIVIIGNGIAGLRARHIRKNQIQNYYCIF
jgi:predicted NAD/FAD-dependent oxidoreductase